MSKNIIHYQLLAVDETPVRDYALTLGTGVYSDAIPVQFSSGFAALLFISRGATDDVDLSYQLSLDGKNWYSPVDTDDNALGAIFTAVTTTKWISFGPLPAKYIRIFIDPDANSTVTIYYIHQEQV